MHFKVILAIICIHCIGCVVSRPTYKGPLPPMPNDYVVDEEETARLRAELLGNGTELHTRGVTLYACLYSKMIGAYRNDKTLQNWLARWSNGQCVYGKYCGDACNGHDFEDTPFDLVDGCCADHDQWFAEAGNPSYLSKAACEMHRDIAFCLPRNDPAGVRLGWLFDNLMNCIGCKW